MVALKLYETKMIGGGVVPAKTVTGKRSCEFSVSGGVGERRGPYVEAKITFKFGG